MQPHENSPKTFFPHLKVPVFIDRFDRPVEFLAQRLREEALDGNVELLREDNGKTRVDVVLRQLS
jgi:hypothetical protein